MRKIYLTEDVFTFVDGEDYDTYSKTPKFLSKDGYAYVIVKENGKWRNRLLSRLIIKAKTGFFVDHINGNKLDNRKINLRICTPYQSSLNRGKHIDSMCKYKGVSANKSSYKNKPWRARIFYKKEIHIGSFATQEEAAIAYNKTAKKLYGEFANLNKIYA